MVGYDIVLWEWKKYRNFAAVNPIITLINAW